MPPPLSGRHTHPRIPTARQLYVLHEASAEDEQHFFTSLRLRNRTFKTTHARRLDDVNQLVLPLLSKATPLKVMDVAVSSGVTTLEWSQSLSAAGIIHEMTAGDAILNGFLVSLGKHVHVLVDDTGYPLQFDFWGRAVPNPVVRRRDLVYWPLIVWVRNRLHAQFRVWKNGCEALPVEQPLQQGRVVCRHIALVSPALQKQPHIEFVDDDIQHNDNLRGRFHAVRAANILNRKYFADEVLRVMLAILRGRLQPEGLLIVCRTTAEGANAATVFRLRDMGTLEVVRRLGEGSEIESLAVSLPPM